jgi:hypothetical protein
MAVMVCNIESGRTAMGMNESLLRMRWSERCKHAQGSIAAVVQEATGESVELIYVDQG